MKTLRFHTALHVDGGILMRKASGFRALSSKAASFTIGDLTLKSRVILSPLERISDVGFRRLCYGRGAGLTWTEMIYASELVRPRGSAAKDLAAARKSPRGNRGANLIDTHDPEVLTGVQLLVDRTTARDGWGVDLLRAALETLEEGAATDRPEWRNICAVDLNFGCPAPAISRRGAGPAQLRRRSKISALFEVLSDWRRTTSLSSIGAVGAKIRLGNNAREQHFKVYLPVAEAAADTLDYLVVHGRHGEQRSRDPPCWEAIAEVKQVTSEKGSALRVIGNGDVRTPDDVRRMLSLTGCDGVMVGRAAMRNPWCLSRLAAAADGGNGDEEGLEEASSEWPSPEELERAVQENAAWSADTPAASRYQRFREENYARLRRECARAAVRLVPGEALAGAGGAARSGRDGAAGTSHSDWYAEWSQASTRRRHLDKMDDAAQADPAAAQRQRPDQASQSKSRSRSSRTASMSPRLRARRRNQHSHRYSGQGSIRRRSSKPSAARSLVSTEVL